METAAAVGKFIVANASTIATTAAAVGASAFQATQNRPQLPQAPEPILPKVKEKQDEAEQDVRRKAAAKARTRGGTLLTGPSGLEDDAPVQRKTLLGQ